MAAMWSECFGLFNCLCERSITDGHHQHMSRALHLTIWILQFYMIQDLFIFLRDHEQMDCVVQMPNHLFASLYRMTKRVRMSSQKLESLLQTYTFFLCPVKHQDPPSIPTRHPDLPCQGCVPSSFCLSSFVLFLPTPTMDTHPIRPSTYA